MSSVTARRKADQLIAEMQINEPAVDVETIARDLGLRVAYMNLAEISGLLITQPGMTPCIVVHEEDYVTRQRFTIAHEIAHFFLRHQFARGEHVHVDRGNLISFRSTRSSTGADPREVEANQFASVLLMPTKMLKRSASRFGIEELMDQQVISLAKEFRVSEQAMTIRLTALGFL